MPTGTYPALLFPYLSLYFLNKSENYHIYRYISSQYFFQHSPVPKNIPEKSDKVIQYGLGMGPNGTVLAWHVHSPGFDSQHHKIIGTAV